MIEDPGSYTDQEFQHALHNQIACMARPSFLHQDENPHAFLLGGQSGAGKTTLHRILSERLEHNAIVVNGDEYRSFHPRYHELDAEFGPECVKHTAPWAGKMTEALIDAFSLMQYNLVIEGTLRTSDVPIKTATLLRERGYSVSLACMAVKPEISLISCQIRYERMRLAGTVPRATDPEHHNAIIRDIVSNIAVLEESDLFDEVSLYSRAGICLYPDGEAQERGGRATAKSASEALEETLFGPWTAQEKDHYRYLSNELEKLKVSQK